ncbi:MAG: hypothetical protein KatS3mg105_2134 [Gemmatales bacterium]|nr:MAG: hypothetical protein KatS3mg105_2134 [Gemmatales bacterium]
MKRQQRQTTKKNSPHASYLYWNKKPTCICYQRPPPDHHRAPGFFKIISTMKFLKHARRKQPDKFCGSGWANCTVGGLV